MVDTDGRGVMLQVYPASVQDRDGAAAGFAWTVTPHIHAAAR
jgi:hypothetical protein